LFLLDGSPVDSSLHGRLGGLANVLPHPIRNVTWRDLAAAYTELTDEINRRQSDASGDHVPIYVFIYDIQRFRDLRKSDDDFGFSSRSYDDEPKAEPPSKMFVTVLRDGPPVGIHTVVWCDSVNNLNRTLDRTGMREFENRILFQMSANDSSTLIDMPAASKLGENRALYYSEEENRIEKFRPYGLPEADWLETVKARFASRPVPEGAVAAPPPAPASAPAAPPAPAPAPPPIGVAEPVFGDGNGAPTSHGDGNGAPTTHEDGDGKSPLERFLEAHAPAPTVDKPGGPPNEG
jgi:DNA segregation ATPase FtsK/SpoIIIE, S-DNA-T family